MPWSQRNGPCLSCHRVPCHDLETPLVRPSIRSPSVTFQAPPGIGKVGHIPASEGGTVPPGLEDICWAPQGHSDPSIPPRCPVPAQSWPHPQGYHILEVQPQVLPLKGRGLGSLHAPPFPPTPGCHERPPTSASGSHCIVHSQLPPSSGIESY